ncbi:MAG: hypothetical protein ABIC36_02865 [bacterium]
MKEIKKKEEIEKIVLKPGLWNNDRRVSHGFCLSPDVYRLKKKHETEFKKIAFALNNCLLGLSRIANMTLDYKVARGRDWNMIRRVLRTGIPRAYRNIQLPYPDLIPSICKVDFIQGVDGRFWISEIDGYNKHGLGYSVLAKRISRFIYPEANRFPGVVFVINKALKEPENKINKLVLIYNNDDRFYLPEFLILQDELKDHDIDLLIESEDNFKIKITTPQFFVDFPILSNLKLRKELIHLYYENKIKFLIPPKPFFSSKAVLALLKNDIQNKEIEKILKSQINSSSLKKIREHIPRTYFVNQEKKIKVEDFVIKGVFSSGSKEVFFSDEPIFKKKLEQAYASGYNFILQEEIVNALNRFKYFSENDKIKEDDWSIRLTVHFNFKEIAEMTVVARKDRKIHGAIDCLQLGVIFE